MLPPRISEVARNNWGIVFILCTASSIGQAQDFSPIDGHGNNHFDPNANSTDSRLARTMYPEYGDNISQMAGANRASPRVISNIVASQDQLVPNSKGLSDFFWAWGQFLDHDIDLTENSVTPEPAPVLVPIGDPWFDPNSTGTASISFARSAYDPSSGVDPQDPRQQMNQITGWIDGSNVYGSDQTRADALRTLDGTGKLKTSPGNLLPFNTGGLPNAGGTGPQLFLAGDVRANEQVGLTAIHTVFVREHNRIADVLSAHYPSMSGDDIYNESRLMVAALIQSITYEEFIPALFGRKNALQRYRGYKPEVDARIMNMFSTAAFRLGHSLLSPQLLRLDSDGQPAAEGPLPLRDAFFAPGEIIDHGIDSVLRGLALQRCQELDVQVIDDVRNFLFGNPGAGGFDLASLNIQRGRDHGLPSYNAVRQYLNMGPAQSFADISSDPEVQSRLANAYNTPDDVDLWVGGLAEDPVNNAIVGPVFYVILQAQFENLRNGDRFWYIRRLSDQHVQIIGSNLLSDVIRRNTNIGGEIPDDIMYVN